jgi:hypothetical protein
MRHSENKKRTLKRKRRKGSQFLRKKESITIATRKNTSPKNTDRLKLIMRKPTIPKKKRKRKTQKKPQLKRPRKALSKKKSDKVIFAIIRPDERTPEEIK